MPIAPKLRSRVLSCIGWEERKKLVEQDAIEPGNGPGSSGCHFSKPVGAVVQQLSVVGELSVSASRSCARSD